MATPGDHLRKKVAGMEANILQESIPLKGDNLGKVFACKCG